MREKMISGRLLRFVGIGVVAAAAVFGATLVLPGSDTKAATKITAFAGGGGKGISVDTFRPKDIFIHPGDSIEWVNPYEEIHTVTFLGDEKETPAFIVPAGPPPAAGPPKLIINPKVSNPTTKASYDGTYANSGVIGKGQTFSLSFNQKGVFEFLCVLHPNMVGAVHVLDEGTTIPTQAALNFDAANQLEKGIAAGLKSVAATKPSTSKNSNGTTTWEVDVPASVGDSSVMQFAPVSLNIGVGDTVTWNNQTFVPHTVTYTAGAPVPAFAVPEFGASGPPTIVLAPNVLFPVNTAKDFTGTAYVNSGFYGIGPESTAPPEFSLTFSKPGSYLFICVLHADQGMSSVVQVGAATGGGGTVRPPSTGDAGLAAGSQPVEAYAALALLGAGVVVIGTLRLKSR